DLRRDFPSTGRALQAGGRRGGDRGVALRRGFEPLLPAREASVLTTRRTERCALAAPWGAARPGILLGRAARLNAPASWPDLRDKLAGLTHRGGHGLASSAPGRETQPRIIPRPEHNVSRSQISSNALKVLY